MKPKTEYLGTHIAADLAQRFRVECAMKARSKSAVLAALVASYVRRCEMRRQKQLDKKVPGEQE